MINFKSSFNQSYLIFFLHQTLNLKKNQQVYILTHHFDPGFK